MSQSPYGDNPQDRFQPEQSNPYAAPQAPVEMTRPSREAIIERIKIPAILMIVAGSLGLIAHIASVVIAALATGLAVNAGQVEPVVSSAQAAGRIAGSVIGVVVDGVVIFGAIKMLKLESWGLALAASFLAMFPCISCGCLIGLPAGIWSLVVLNDVHVKDTFD